MEHRKITTAILTLGIIGFSFFTSCTEKKNITQEVRQDTIPQLDKSLALKPPMGWNSCYCLGWGATESEAETLEAIIEEMLLAKTSERQGRLIDHDSSGSMEEKKREGYF